ncbi:polymeric immunoglobulin receptor-like isoform X2 [Pelmatolapia mariae]|uniref:polymeric immunoglobulin receptor-like isoform X2 n=1 Tax=Pelmatolapia mariae TaxID=158779 RepID=UPI002FE568F6
MKVHHTLICFFFLSLQDGNPEVNINKNISFGVVGRNLTAEFPFTAVTWKMFCRGECKGGNVLINTTDEKHQSHRYSIELKQENGAPTLSVSITQLIMSDAGRYSCAAGESPSSVSYKQFEVVVAEALLDGNNPAQLKHFNKETGSSLTVGCYFNQSGGQKFFCRGECGEDEVLLQTDDEDDFKDRYRIGFRGPSEKTYTGGGILYVTITQVTESDSGRYRCSLNRSPGQGSFRDFVLSVTDVVQSAFSPSLTSSVTTEHPEKTSEDDLPSVGLTVAVIIIIIIIIIVLSSLAVLIICIKRKSNRGLRTRGNSEGTNMEDVHYENCTPGSTREDSTYQSLDPAGRDQDQTYSTLTDHT